jgi:hypothetical protein
MIPLALLALFTQELKEGAVFDLGGRTATVRKADVLPYVESDYTKRFTFDSFDNPKLKELREKYRLDEVVAAGRDEFDRQVLLNDWVHVQFKKFGRPSANPQGALEWVDRTLALRRHKDYPNAGAPEHSTTEIWSNQHRKWIMLDPTANMFVEKAGVPLGGFEIRTEWFSHEGKDLVFSIGRERKK